MPRALSRMLWTLCALLSVAIAFYAYRYVAPATPAPPGVRANPFFSPFLLLHVTGAATALLVGPVQFLAGLRARRPALHRALGRLYVAGCLVGGLAGLVLSLGSTAGPIATAGFGLLALAWLWTTGQAVHHAIARRIPEHRAWMIRSFSLTFAAVTLRLYLPLAAITGLPMAEAYLAISFLCWVPNLLIAELSLRRSPSPQTAPAGT
ncbi:hypothetical protein DMC25_03480 [Caulobacter sp. D4A]|uniref:DUF2306 domain-containing protein n=1 Tax=unclassified Caulobacter TaxID=2648921 RepID=UPI000D730140|nr:MULTISPECIES: DUF2306 domain-containing protein [unclassified Caulobacter]PXA92201.1 hypothetical protein DMC18_11685 [Caulobacter sp. D5]PXA93551.1 hypothetical protein DMC25_03480 [Caulobacter sp. D4A]